MNTLDDPAVVADLKSRLTRLQVDGRRRWGTMSAHQMLCHVADAFAAALGELEVRPLRTVLGSTVMKWGALWMPLRWPHGVPTRAEIDPTRRGTRPAVFEADRRRVLELMDRFVREGGSDPEAVHVLFGPLSRREWLRWGWLHTDHHLRQFGV